MIPNEHSDGEDGFSSCTELTGKLYSTCVCYHGLAKTVLLIEDVTPSDQKDKRSALRVTRSGTRLASTRSVSIIEPTILDQSSLEEESQEMEEARKTHAAESSDEDVDGKELFGFKTPKRSRLSSAKSTPRSGKKSDGGSTPGHGSKTRSRTKKIEATTPYRLAARHKTDEELSDDSMIESSDDESVVDGSETSKRNSNRATGQSIPSMAEDFFKAQANKPVTSDHTLAKLREDGYLDQLSIKQILDKRPNRYESSMKLLAEEHQASFNSWMIQLCLGFNLVLYGYGSKKGLIEKFRKDYCSDFHCVVVNGFFPSLTLKNILSTIYEDCLGISDKTPDTDLAVSEIIDYVTQKDEALFIFVHNIDASMLRYSAIQQALATLASSSNIHLIASVDHINAPLLWDQALATKYNWLWYDATTFEPYIEETSYENSLMTQQTGSLALKSMINVFKSLTPNAKNIFIMLANYHLEHCEEQSYIGMSFQMLYQKCREGFLVNSDQTLRTQLIEFRDHKLIRSKKGADGAEHLYLPTDSSTLRDFIDQAQANG